MQSTATPSRFPIPFANSGTKNAIPELSQIGITPGAASLTDGFPPLTFTSLAAGGIPPSGADFNGILNMLSAGLQWANAGGMYAYDSTFSTSIGGYPKGAVLVRSDGTGLWISNADNNTTDPDAAVSANWTPIYPGRVTTVTATGSITIANCGLVLVDATAGNITITLPAASALSAASFVFIRTDATANTATISRSGTDTIDSATSASLTNALPLALIGDGASSWLSSAPSRAKLDAIYAALAGNSAQTFNVAAAASANNAINYSQALGLGQTWQNMTASRAFGTVYTNTTSAPIVVQVNTSSASAPTLSIYIAGSLIQQPAASVTMRLWSEFTVPVGASYQVTSTTTIGTWYELR